MTPTDAPSTDDTPRPADADDTLDGLDAATGGGLIEWVKGLFSDDEEEGGSFGGGGAGGTW